LIFPCPNVCTNRHLSSLPDVLVGFYSIWRAADNLSLTYIHCCRASSAKHDPKGWDGIRSDGTIRLADRFGWFMHWGYSVSTLNCVIDRPKWMTVVWQLGPIALLYRVTLTKKRFFRNAWQIPLPHAFEIDISKLESWNGHATNYICMCRHLSGFRSKCWGFLLPYNLPILLKK